MRSTRRTRRWTCSSTISAIFEPKPFEDIPDDDWRRFFEVNVLSGVRLSRLYLPGMKARNWGRVLFISSESGVQIPAEMIHYGVTKTAQLAVSRGLAETCAGTAVTINAVLPGPTRSAGAAKFAALASPLAWSFLVLVIAAKQHMASVSGFVQIETAFTAIQYLVVSPLIALAFSYQRA